MNSGKVKRVSDLYITLREVPEPDAGALLRGEVAFKPRTCFIVTLPSDGREFRLTAEEMSALAQFPADTWSDADAVAKQYSIDERLISRLVKRGLLVTEGSPASSIAQKLSQIYGAGWNRNSHFYHRKSTWSAPVRGPEAEGAAVRAGISKSANLFSELVERHGAPPPEFYSVGSDLDPVELPLLTNRGALYDSLRRRETARNFDNSESLPLASLSILLYYTFGCFGTLALTDELVVLKKCSPSGGALHPVEAYPLMVDVEGIPTGLYHYSAEHHSLEPIRHLDQARAREIMSDFAAGQEWPGSAHCMIVMTARFDRHFWKYRQNSKAYKVLYLDAGHLSQTFYLLCADLGLGAFFSAAVNDAQIGQQLGLRPDLEGAIGVCGCGIPGKSDALRFAYTPYNPPRDDGNGGGATAG